MTDLDHRPEAPATPTATDITASKPLTVVGPKITTWQRVVAIWRYRELLVGMTRKELRVQYKDSALGFVWSLVNPAVTLLVYYIVFQKILGNGMPKFAVYLACGILVWNFFQAALPAACGSVVASAGIIKKVAFPREIPALANVGNALVQMGLQSIVLVAFLIMFKSTPDVAYLPLLIPAIIGLVLFTAALGIFLAALNVRYRDTTHITLVSLSVWFWATPIVYQYRTIRDSVITKHHLPSTLFYLYRCNPISPIVETFQRAIYAKTTTESINTPPGPIHILPDHAGRWWYLWQLLLVIAAGLIVLVLALKYFGKVEGDFAEEL